MEQEFKILNSQTENVRENLSDIKGYFFRVLSNWRLFLITIPIALAVAYYVNISTERIYSLHSTIAVKEKQNPLFSTGTNIAFNWGGVSDKVESIRRVLSSRSHNEKVVRELEYYIDYLRQGRFRVEDSYGDTPFLVKLKTDKFQLTNTIITIEFIDNYRFKLSVDFGEESKVSMINYQNNKTHIYDVTTPTFSEEYKLDEQINLPFLNFTLASVEGLGNISDKPYMIRFLSLDQSVSKYRKVNATLIPNTSLLNVSQSGPNKKRIVDYVNKTVDVLSIAALQDKTNYAFQTLDFITEQFKNTEDSLRLIESNIGKYKKSKGIYNLSLEGSQIFSETTGLDKNQRDLTDRLEYYNNLEDYINTSQNYIDVPAPAIVNIEDESIGEKIRVFTQLSTEKEKLKQEVTSNHPSLIALNQEIQTTKQILLENVSSLKNLLNLNIKNSKRRESDYNYQLKRLPEKEQKLLNFQRKYALTESNYLYLLQKGYEARTAIAATVSDITVLDSAKDTGQKSSKPRKPFNYMVGLLLGTLLPLFIIIAIEVLDTKIQTVEDIEVLSPIPILGVVGKKTTINNLSVFLKPKSTVAESFRALRSNIHFLFDRKKINESKTVMITSSISGEGKTFVSINMATVFALSGKKTILVGLDLRKPKIFGDFDIDNDEGVVNYLIGQKTIEEIIIPSKIENLDIITSGNVPPNPSELIMNSANEELMEYLKKNYEYIILDTPPVGLVADAFELVKYADVTLYVVRQGFTQKGMMKMINDKYAKKEVSNISIILNNFKIKSSYGYGHGYGYGYGQGYHEVEKIPLYKKIFRFIIGK
ncbi:MAG: polysaccharide biosynthesis tyrosine autokinase [Urechidicola sp.]